MCQDWLTIAYFSSVQSLSHVWLFATPWAAEWVSEIAQSCQTLCDPMDCSLPGSSLHGILQARVLEWVAFSFSRGSSQPRDRTQVSCIPGRHFNLWATREAPEYHLKHVVATCPVKSLKMFSWLGVEPGATTVNTSNHCTGPPGNSRGGCSLALCTCPVQPMPASPIPYSPRWFSYILAPGPG